eukprot:2195628-Rhodomonas_salina.1
MRVVVHERKRKKEQKVRAESIEYICGQMRVCAWTGTEQKEAKKRRKNRAWSKKIKKKKKKGKTRDAVREESGLEGRVERRRVFLVTARGKRSGRGHREKEGKKEKKKKKKKKNKEKKKKK